MKELNHEEYKALVADEFGDVLPRPALLQAFEPDDWVQEGFDWDTPNEAGLRVILLNVAEPHMYRTEEGKVVVVLPQGPITYQDINSFFPAKNAWVYTLSDSVDADLDERFYFFRYGRGESEGNQPLPRFKANDISTH